MKDAAVIPHEQVVAIARAMGSPHTPSDLLNLPGIIERRQICEKCPKNRGLGLLTVACDCRTCQAKPLDTWACPDGHFPALRKGRRGGGEGKACRTSCRDANTACIDHAAGADVPHQARHARMACKFRRLLG
jgi:hypothetical protein